MSGADACPACGAAELAVAASWAEWEAAARMRPDGAMRLEAARRAGVAEAAPSLMRCAGCGTVSMKPAPSPDQLAAFYQNYHAASAFEAKAAKKIARARKRIRVLAPFVRGRRFLDVGASIGAAGEAARRAGFAATALELDGAAVETGRRLFPDVAFVATSVETWADDRVFDLVYAAEIIEHAGDPAAMARALRARLAEGGLLFLTTPDAGHPRRPKRLLDWKSVKPPEHVTLFTRAGLRALFRAAGFRSIIFLPQAKPGVRMIARGG